MGWVGTELCWDGLGWVVMGCSAGHGTGHENNHLRQHDLRMGWDGFCWDGLGWVVKELPGYDQRQHVLRMMRLDDCDFDPEIEALLARPERAGLGNPNMTLPDIDFHHKSKHYDNSNAKLPVFNIFTGTIIPDLMDYSLRGEVREGMLIKF
jgi:hypothetical protein